MQAGYRWVMLAMAGCGGLDSFVPTDLGTDTDDVPAVDDSGPTAQPGDTDTGEPDLGGAIGLREDFEACVGAPAGWTLRGDWACGSAPGAPGPTSAPSGDTLLATRPDGPYSANIGWLDGYAELPPVDLTGIAEPVLAFQAWTSTEAGADGWNVSLSGDGGRSFQPAIGVTPAYNGDLFGLGMWTGQGGGAGWVRYEVDLSSVAGRTAIARLGFASDDRNQAPGVYVDDVFIGERSLVPVVITPVDLPEAVEGEPYAYTLTRVGGGSGARWSLGPGAPGWLRVDGATGALSGTPAAGDVGLRDVTFVLNDPSAPANRGEITAPLRVVQGVAGWTFASCPAGWTLAADWACGVPTSGPGGTARGGTLATRLDGDYANNRGWDASTALSPPFSLPVGASRLRLRAWWSFESGFDGWNLSVVPLGGSPQLVSASVIYASSSVGGAAAWTGDSGDWVDIEADLSAWSGQDVQLLLAYRTDGSATRPGVYVDELTVVSDATTLAPVAVTTTTLPSAGVGQPWQASLSATGGGLARTWALGPGAPGWISLDPATGTLSGTPAAGDAGTTSLTVTVTSAADPSNTASATLSLEVRDDVAWWDFSQCPQGWTLTADWACGAPGSAAPASLDGGVLATNLVANHLSSRSYAATTATSPSFRVPAQGAEVRLSAWWAFEAGYDGWNLAVLPAGGTRTVLPADVPFNNPSLAGEPAWWGPVTGWQQLTADLSDFAGQDVQLQLAYRSDSSTTNPGVFVEDITVAIPALSVLTTGLPRARVGTPWTAPLARRGGATTVTWSLGAGAPAWVTIDPVAGTLSGTPGALDVGQLAVPVVVTDSAGAVATATLTLEVRDEVISWDFAACPDGWTLAADWACGAPTSGPGATADGGVLATNLSGNYASNRAWATSVATSPPVTLPDGLAEARVRAWWDTESSFDGWHVNVVPLGGAPVPVAASRAFDSASLAGEPAWWGSSGGWVDLVVPLGAFADQQVQLQLAYRTDSSTTRAGVYVDEILVVLPPLTVDLAGVPSAAAVGVRWEGAPARTGGPTTVRWSLGAGAPAWVGIDPATGALSGVPPAAALGQVPLTVIAADPANAAITASATLTLTVGDAVADWAFTACPEGWTLTSDWACGAPTSGPPAPPDNGVLATNLAGDYGNSRAWATSTATSPPLRVPLGGAEVRVEAWWDYELNYDGWNLSVLPDGGAAVALPTSPPPPNANLAGEPAFTGVSGGFVQITADLGPWAGQTVRLELAQRTDGGLVRPGVYVDRVEVRLPPLAITTSTLPLARVGRPWSAQLSRRGGSDAATWSLGAGAPAWIAVDPATGALSGTPGLADAGPVALDVVLNDPLGATPTTTATLPLTVRQDLVAQDFASCPGGFTFTGGWACGLPTAGPSSAPDGSPLGNAIGTVLSGNYANNLQWTDAVATSPPVAIPAGGATVELVAWWAFEDSYDGWHVEVQPASGPASVLTAVTPATTHTLRGLPAWSGTSPGWVTVAGDLSAWAGQTVTLRLRVSSDVSQVRDGVFVHSVTLY